MTVCTADYFQHYIPIFVWSILRVWDDVGIIIYLRGALDDITKDALSHVLKSWDKGSRLKIIEHYKTDYLGKRTIR